MRLSWKQEEGISRVIFKLTREEAAKCRKEGISEERKSQAGGTARTKALGLGKSLALLRS